MSFTRVIQGFTELIALFVIGRGWMYRYPRYHWDSIIIQYIQLYIPKYHFKNVQISF